MDNKYTAFCGIYCLDCIPSNEKFFSLIEELEYFLKDLQFERYAEFKSLQNPVFDKYGEFKKVLSEIGKLKCKVPCTEGGGKSNCPVRECVLEKKVRGCWECEERKDCAKLEVLKTIHPHLNDHLELIREYGTERWVMQRKSHYAWQTNHQN